MAPRAARCGAATAAALLLACALLAGSAHAGSESSAAYDPSNAADKISSTASAAAAGAKKASTACGKQCFAKAQQLGFERVAGDSTACFMPYKGKSLSTYDCCDKAEQLLGERGPLANCLCCPEFANAMVSAVPHAQIGTTPKAFLEKLHLCRVPIVGQNSCKRAAAAAAKERGAVYVAPPFVAPTLDRASPPPPPRVVRESAYGRPLYIIETFNLTGLFPLTGFDPRFDTGILAAQGRQAVKDGKIERITVVGASDIYNDYITGFVMWIEQNTPRYSVPKLPALPPLPEQYKDDVAWVASLRRGAYPDLIYNRPPQFAPAATDPLQNGQIARLPPGEVFGGRPSPLSATGIKG